MINVNTTFKQGKMTWFDFSSMSLEDRGLSDKMQCENIYNLNNKKCVLTGGLGVRELSVPLFDDVNSEQINLDYGALNMDEINKVMHFKQYFPTSGDTTHRLLFHGSDNKLYMHQMFSNLDSIHWAYQLSFTTPPIVLEYKLNGLDSILISSDEKLVVWSTNLAPYEINNVPTITSMCIYDDSLYCTLAKESDKIWYTTGLNPEDIGVESEHTKYITLSDDCGAGRKIVAFKEKLYVFRDYGITRINTFSTQDPTYTQIYLSDSKIYSNTVAVCGDVIMFMTRDGVYKFNGVSVTKVDCIVSELIEDINDYAVATNMQDKYYLALRMRFDDEQQILCEQTEGYKNNALIELDLQKYSLQIMRGVDIKDMLALKAGFVEKIVLTFNSKDKNRIGEITNDGKYFDEVLPKFYSSNYIINKNLAECTIRTVRVDASKNVTVSIISEQEKYNYTTYVDGVNEFQTIIPCRKFKIEVSSNESQPYLSLIELDYVERK